MIVVDVILAEVAKFVRLSNATYTYTCNVYKVRIQIEHEVEIDLYQHLQIEHEVEIHSRVFTRAIYRRTFYFIELFWKKPS